MSRRTAAISAEQWQRVEPLLASVLELAEPARGAWLNRECGSDAALRAELESLIAAHEATGLLDRPITLLSENMPAFTAAEPKPGAIVSHYELQERLGSGGMGVVYRARDLRLERTVALKFLPVARADTQARERFLAEARAAAVLEHSNVCTVHEIGETPDGQLFIAMAFVAGRSLRQLINDGPLHVERAVEIARQVAAGLEAAHSHGIVHRDVKPANVMVGDDGVVKLVDFGIAKYSGLSVTSTGVLPGTPAYMSPEQARAEVIDARADVWALGVVLYEMLAAQRPFAGDRDVALLHAILNAEPPGLHTLCPGLPAPLARIVERSLAKDREQRFQSATELRVALSRFAGEMPALEPRKAVVRGPARFTRLSALAAVAALFATGGIGAYVWLVPAPPAGTETLRLSISAPGTITPQLSTAISPNGREVAFVATDSSGKAMLWVRSLDQLQARPLPGTERAAHPFWSPDGKSLGFIADNRVKRVDLAGGPAQTLADNVPRWGAAWGSAGTIVFTPRVGALAAVPATGGAVTHVLPADSSDLGALLWPRFLPDGRHFIYFAAAERPEQRGIYVGSLDSKETKYLLRTDFRAFYSPPGYLVYARDEALVAQPFDATRLEVRGEPTVIANGVWFARPAGQASFSVSETGALAYVNATLWDGELAWFDRTGRPLGSAGPPVRYEGLTPEVSPDGRRIAVTRGEFGRENVWIVGAAGEGASRLSVGPNDASRIAVWASDGRRVMYTVGPRLVVKDVDTGGEEIVLDSVPGILQDWSRDGRFVVFQKAVTRAHLWVVRLDGDRIPFQFWNSPYNEAQAQLSPDARWMAYTSNESGHDEVYVQAFPMAGRKRQVSAQGGAMPRWRADGKELFYLAGNQYITAVPVIDSHSLEFGRPTPLFRTRLVVEGSESIGLPSKYDVAPDGQRFVLRYPPVDPGPPITVVINWIHALKH